MGIGPSWELEIIGRVIAQLDKIVTEEQLYENALVAAKDKAEVASRAKSELIAAVSHELRIPLTGIIGMAQLLSIDCLLPGQKDQVEDILKASEHLLSLVNDLLDLTKLEAGKMELHTSFTNLKMLVVETTNMLNVQAHMKGLEFIVDYVPNLPDYVVADTRVVRQVLLNLIGNAIKFTEKGYIRIKIEALKKTDNQVLLQFMVQDTGVGISVEHEKNIFDRFSQVDSAYSRRYGGTGLGLTLTKHLVELMGGNIHVESEVGKGSAFICVIPFLLQEPASVASPWEIYKTKVRVLVVDDALHGEMLYKHFMGSNAQVVSGKDCLQVLLAAERYGTPYDIVLVDQHLTTVDILQLAHVITKRLARSRPLLVLLMASGAAIDKAEAKKSGYFDFLIKPLQPSELLIDLKAVWERWLETGRQEKKSDVKDHSLDKPYVLLVEDDVIVQKVHKIMLERAGCKVEIAKDGQQALDMFKRNYDLIFMDVGLPGISGLEITRKMREQEAQTQQHIPIIAMTAYVHEEDRNNCLAVGMDEVATKPISPAALKELLDRWISKISAVPAVPADAKR